MAAEQKFTNTKIYIDETKTAEIRIFFDRELQAFSIDAVPAQGVEVTRGVQHYINNLNKILRVEANRTTKKIEIQVGQIKLAELDDTDYETYAEIDVRTNTCNNFYYLTTSEQRLLSQGDVTDIASVGVPFKREETVTPKTDLHTHFSGAVSVETCEEIGREYNVLITQELLIDAGINLEPYINAGTSEVYKERTKAGELVEKHGVRFNTLTEEDRKTYMSNLSIGINSQETFIRMEECYEFRDPFVKLKQPFFDPSLKEEAFEKLLASVAREYDKNGVEYVELSDAGACKDIEFVKLLNKVMPKIEEQFKVKIRFLGGIPRAMSPKIFGDRMQVLLNVAKCPYIVGFDAMGHETNRSQDFGAAIKSSMEYAIQNKDANWVTRIHAGESGVFEDNVLEVLQIAQTLRAENGITEPGLPLIRIGHGLHGMKQSTMDLVKELGAIIEINISSNLALNNVDALKQVPIKQYLDYGIKIVLGSDGPGMYHTDARQEAVLAIASGLTPEDMKKIVGFEQAYIAAMDKSYEIDRQNDIEARARYQEHPKREPIEAGDYEIDRYERSEVEISYLEETNNLQRKREREAETAAKYKETLEAKQIQVIDSAKPFPTIEGKKPIYIIGYMERDWQNLTSEQRKQVLMEVAKFIANVNIEKYYFVTSTSSLGLNGQVLKLIHELQPRAQVVGIVPEQKLGHPNNSTLVTHVKTTKNNTFKSSTSIIRNINAQDGMVVAFGDGTLTNDHIQNAHNMNSNLKLYNAPNATKPKFLAGNGYEFDDAMQILNDNEKRRDLSPEELDKLLAIVTITEEQYAPDLDFEKEGYTDAN